MRRPRGKLREAVTADEKRDVVTYLSLHTMKDTLAHFYDQLTPEQKESKRKQIYKWQKAASSIANQCKTMVGRDKHKARPRNVGLSLSPELELRIVRWVNRLRGEGVPISTLMFQLHALEVASEAGVTSFVASPTWQRRFKKTHRLSMRTRTRQGQISPEDAQARAEAFAAKVHAKMAELGVTVVHNADQTAVFFEYLPKKTMAPTGSKTVWVRCAGKDRQRCTVMLLADSTGRKFTPTVVLKTRPSTLMHVLVENIVERQGFGRFLWKRIKTIQDETGLTIHTNSAGWWNEFLHREFLRSHFGDRGENPPPILLLLDEFSGHWTEPTMAYAASINVHLMRVPAGLTSVCQPADVSWMRPFKDYMRGEWISFLRDQVRGLVPGTEFKMKPAVYEDVCAWVRVAWDKVSQSTVQAGYRRTGIIHANDIIEHLEIDGEIGEVTEEAEFDN